MAIFHASRRRLLIAGLAVMMTAATGANAVDESQPASSETAATPALPTIDPSTIVEATPDFLRLGADMSDRMTMPVQIGGLGPYPFIIDTGSYRSIVATELAQRLMLQTLPPVQIISMAGKETVASVHLDELRFGTQVVNDLPALSIAHNDLGSPGLIGLDSLKDKRLMLDFRKRSMEVGRSTPTPLISYDHNVIVVQARSRLGQLILVNSKIDGKRVNVILDTGAEMSVGNMALFNKLKQKRLLIPPQPVTIRSVTGQAVPATFTVVRRIEIGSVNLGNVPMVFLDAAPFAELGLEDKPSMLLGMRMLRMFNRVAIDFGSRHVDFDVPQSSNGDGLRDRQIASLLPQTGMAR